MSGSGGKGAGETKDPEETGGEEGRDELFDDEQDDTDAKWVRTQRLHSVPLEKRLQGQLGPTAAFLHCPCCFTSLCFDCQRHDHYPHQYRAMFTRNCRVVTDERIRFRPVAEDGVDSGVAAVVVDPRLGRGFDRVPTTGGHEECVCELFYPVKCELCGTEVAVLDQEEVYHFYNVVAGSS